MSDDLYAESPTATKPARVQAFLMTSFVERFGGSRWPFIGLSVLILLLVIIGGFVGANSSPQG